MQPEQFYTRPTTQRNPKNNLQPRPKFFDGLYAFLFLFEMYHSWQRWGVCLGSCPEVKQMFLMVLFRAPGQISAHSARHIPLFISPSPSLHLFCLSPHNSTQVSGCSSDWLSGSLCTARMGSFIAVLWYNDLIGFASTEHLWESEREK